MKYLSYIVVSFALIGLLFCSCLAQTPKSKIELMKEIQQLSNTKNPDDSAKAYQLSLEVIARFGNETADTNIAKIRDFVRRYRENQFFKSFEEKKYSDFYRIGKDILVDEPNNLDVLMNLGYGGYDIVVKSNDRSFVDDALKYTRLAIAQFDLGNMPQNLSPFTTKSEANAWLHYVVAYFLSDKDLATSVAHFYKSTLFESSIKSTGQPYYAIAYHYEKQYEKLSGEHNAKVAAKSMNEDTAAQSMKNIEIVIDRMMDAYARAVTFAEKEKNPSAPTWRKRLAELYLFRKKTDEGLDAFIKQAISTPMPDPGKP